MHADAWARPSSKPSDQRYYVSFSFRPTEDAQEHRTDFDLTKARARRVAEALRKGGLHRVKVEWMGDDR